MLAQYDKDRRLFRMVYGIIAALLFFGVFSYLLINGIEHWGQPLALIGIILFGILAPKIHMHRLKTVAGAYVFTREEKLKQQASEK